MAKYEAAQRTDDNARHWQLVDGLSANAANDRETRRILRNRSRYEISNNAEAFAIIETRVLETVGCHGPRPQITTNDTSRDWTESINRLEFLYSQHCRKIKLNRKRMTLVRAAHYDGEAFAVAASNPKLPKTEPQLDIRLFECDRVTSPAGQPTDPLFVDGIEFDSFGNPVRYDFLKSHPGDRLQLQPQAKETIGAEKVFHLFFPTRPEQVRGIPSLTPSLTVFNNVRRYEEAELKAAETQACIVAFLKTPEPAQTYDVTGTEGDAQSNSGAERIDVEHVTGYTLPEGYSAEFAQPTHPQANSAEFSKAQIKKAGRAVLAPEAIALGSAAGYNFSSSRFDGYAWQRSIMSDRSLLDVVFEEPFFWLWFAEASLIKGYLPELPPQESLSIHWQWQGWPSVSPKDDNTAIQIALNSGFMTFAQVASERGLDWREMLQQRATEKQFLEELGLPVPGAVAPPRQQPPGDNQDTGDDNSEEDAPGEE